MININVIINGEDVSYNVFKRVMRIINMASKKASKKLAAEKILYFILWYFHITKEELINKVAVDAPYTKSDIQNMRHLFAYFSYLYAVESSTVCANMLNMGSYASIIHGKSKIVDWLDTEKSIRIFVRDIQGLIDNYFELHKTQQL